METQRSRSDDLIAEATMSDRMPTTAEVRKRFVDGFRWAVSRDECGRDFDRWLVALIAEKQAEALQLAAKAIQGRVDPEATHCAVHVNAGLLLACDELSDQAQRLREQATNQSPDQDQPDRSTR